MRRTQQGSRPHPNHNRPRCSRVIEWNAAFHSVETGRGPLGRLASVMQAEAQPHQEAHCEASSGQEEHFAGQATQAPVFRSRPIELPSTHMQAVHFCGSGGQSGEGSGCSTHRQGRRAADCKPHWVSSSSVPPRLPPPHLGIAAAGLALVVLTLHALACHQAVAVSADDARVQALGAVCWAGGQRQAVQLR